MSEEIQTLGEESIAPDANPVYATVGEGLVPELGTVAKVVAAAGLSVRRAEGGYYSETEPTEVSVTHYVYQLLLDGDLVVVQE